MREVIYNTLWIGNARDARSVESVLGLGIAAVIDLAMEEPPHVYPRELIYCRLPLVDSPGNQPAVIHAAIDTVASFLRSQLPTLVACSDGMSRSPAIVALALAAVDGLTPEEGLKRVAEKGPHDVAPAFWSEARETALQRLQKR
jgi:protein-tyrosine phosphatase